MVKVKRKYIFWISTIFLIFLSVNFFILYLKIKPTKYSILNSAEPSIYSLFCDSIKKDIRFDIGYGNEIEKVLIFNYTNKYNLIIWDIAGYSEVSPYDITMGTNNEFESVKFNPGRFTEYGYPKIMIHSQIDTLQTDMLTIHLHEDSDLINRVRHDNLLYFSVEGKGIVCAKSEMDYQLKIEVENPLVFNAAFLKFDNKFYIMFLAPVDENNVGNELIQILNKEYFNTEL